MKRAAYHNLGCKVNSYELDVMKELLEKKGYETVPFDREADIYVINTCTVTNIADRKRQTRPLIWPSATTVRDRSPNCWRISSGPENRAVRDRMERQRQTPFSKRTRRPRFRTLFWTLFWTLVLTPFRTRPWAAGPWRTWRSGRNMRTCS